MECVTLLTTINTYFEFNLLKYKSTVSSLELGQMIAGTSSLSTNRTSFAENPLSAILIRAWFENREESFSSLLCYNAQDINC